MLHTQTFIFDHYLTTTTTLFILSSSTTTIIIIKNVDRILLKNSVAFKPSLIKKKKKIIHQSDGTSFWLDNIKSAFSFGYVWNAYFEKLYAS